MVSSAHVPSYLLLYVGGLYGKGRGRWLGCCAPGGLISIEPNPSSFNTSVVDQKKSLAFKMRVLVAVSGEGSS